MNRRRPLFDLINGIRFRYPLCCTLRFIWDIDFRGLPPATLRQSPDLECKYTPCGIFHKAVEECSQFAFFCEEHGSIPCYVNTEEEMYEWKVTSVIYRPKESRAEL